MAAAFEATRVVGGVRLELSGESAEALAEIFRMLSKKIIKGDPRLRRRMFPVAYDRQTWASDFWHDHGESMRNKVCDALDRVFANWPGKGPVTLDLNAVDDWCLALTHAQLLYTGRRAGDLAQRARAGDQAAGNVLWLRSAQSELLIAAVPGLR
ncbi:MAG TPA: hypothetical protein VGP26_12215 [Actinophytocola sp.]|jgi:hypothetical protein|nr:hypothetical protein [Actinophytocola sp.]